MSGLYGAGKQRLAGSSDWTSGTYYAVVVNTSGTGTLYTYARTHATMASVPSASRISDPVALASKTVNADGELSCAAFTATGLTGGEETSEAVVIYEETAAADASRYPLLFIDGMTIIPNGGNYTFTPQGTSPYLGRL
jgi:hypothetical protein